MFRKVLYFLFAIVVIIIFYSCLVAEEIKNKKNLKSPVFMPLKFENPLTFENSDLGIINMSISNVSVSIPSDSYNVINHLPLFGGLGNSVIRQDADSYFLTGNIIVHQNLPTLNFIDELILNNDAKVGDVLNIIKGSRKDENIYIKTNIFEGYGIPELILNSKIHITSVLPAMAIKEKIYEKIKGITWSYSVQLNLKMTGVLSDTISLNLTHKLIPNQKIGEFTQYFADGVGIIQSELILDGADLQTDTNVNLNTKNIELERFVIGDIQLIKRIKKSFLTTKSK